MKVGKDWTRALHAATFGVFMYVGVRFILDNLIKQIINGTVVEGTGGEDHPPVDEAQVDEAQVDDPSVEDDYDEGK